MSRPEDELWSEASEAEERYRILAELASDAILVMDEDDNLLFVNPGAARIFGWNRDELIGSKLTELMPERMRARHRAGIGRYLATGERHLDWSGIELPGLHRSGKELTLHIAFAEHRVAGRRTFIGYARDITARKELERERDRLLVDERVARRRSDAERARIRAMFESVPDALLFLDAERRTVEGNRRAEELFGGIPAEPTAYLRLIRQPDGTPLRVDELPGQRALRGERVERQELLVVRGDGVRVPVAASASPVDAGEGLVGAVVSYEDIGAAKELERLREEWTSLIAHDLRQPITIISARAALLARKLAKGVAPAERERELEHIRTAAANLDKMVEDLLDLSRIEARRLRIEPRPVDPGQLVRDILQRVEGMSPDRPLRFLLAGPVPTVCADPARIEQVMVNLLSNAVKYGAPGTPIDVEVRGAGDAACIGVTNRGPGIAPEELGRLFTRFHRTRGARSSDVPGLGLGLHICKGIVEAHGGRIWAESEPGATTTFRFSLPAAGSGDAVQP